MNSYLSHTKPTGRLRIKVLSSIFDVHPNKYVLTAKRAKILSETEPDKPAVLQREMEEVRNNNAYKLTWEDVPLVLE